MESTGDILSALAEGNRLIRVLPVLFYLARQVDDALLCAKLLDHLSGMLFPYEAVSQSRGIELKSEWHWRAGRTAYLGISVPARLRLVMTAQGV